MSQDSPKAAGINIQGEPPSVEAVESAREAIMDILHSSNDQETKRFALETLRKVFCTTSGITVSDFSIQGPIQTVGEAKENQKGND